jgi:hypothetical protein
LLVRSGALSPEKATAAERRRAVYGGSLDTVLLEMGLADEATLRTHLADTTGLPAALPERLAAPAQGKRRLEASEARRLGAVPLEAPGNTIELALHPEAAMGDRTAVLSWAKTQELTVALSVAPEVRFHQRMSVVYGEPPPARYWVLLGKLTGPETRRQALELLPTIVPPPVDTGPRLRGPEPVPPEPEIEVTEEAAAAPPAPTAAETHGELQRLLSQVLAPELKVATRAIARLGELGAASAVPILLERLGDKRPDMAEAARIALVAITRQDFGRSRRPWNHWWQEARGKDRVEWLMDALGHKNPELRLAASDELRQLTGTYFGYHFDLPERDRDEARRRWLDWWRTNVSGK